MGVTTEIVMDTDVTLALAYSGQLSVLGNLAEFRFHLTEVNQDEIKDPTASEIVAEGIESGALRLTRLEGPAALVLLGRFSARMHDGEAAAAAQAALIGGILATHDVKARKVAARLLPELQFCVLEDIFVEAVRGGALAVSDIEEAQRRLRAAEDYDLPLARDGVAALVADARRGLRRLGARGQLM